MRVARLELSGIGPFEDAVFEVPEPPAGSSGELVFFEGPNGCGKTTIAQAIALAACPGVLVDRERQDLRLPTNAWMRRFRRLVQARAQVLLGVRDAVGVVQIDQDYVRVASGPGFHLGNDRVTQGAPGPAVPRCHAYAFRGHQPTPVLDSPGPRELDVEHIRRRDLFFGEDPAAQFFGQLLINLDYDRARTFAFIPRAIGEERTKLEASHQSLDAAIRRFEVALSRVLDRRVEIRFELGRITPRILFDDQEIPLDMLGEGLRSTLSWLADLLVRLELTPWERKDISPFDQEFWLILDEVEVNLHPAMQARLFPTLRKLFPNARIYATVHSPFAVAAAGEGTVFSIRPRKDRLVAGPQTVIKLEPGQSLAWVVKEVFGIEQRFLDEETERKLEEHERAVNTLAAGHPIDWPSFLALRRWLMDLNEQVATLVAMREVEVQDSIDEKIEQAEDAAP
ncbi:AAA family ATPase [Polyangium fumosum]|uniref:AAA+ ATPase domain-containing protein n=1 Tax=Polyangium fumosum TaxID=889272 RepID=A0A4V6WQS5_9BACT|nr:AAA family ATPase [Polyangium fumosum]TKD08884.1 hypothetical protein E8A74_13930 [Polyangium fumosum]